MSKTIKLDQEVYQDLDKLRRKDETFSQSVSRLLSIYDHVEKMYHSMARGKKLCGLEPGKGIG